MRKKKITARPLTKRHSAGNLYVRPERVEAQINEILCQDLATLKHRLAVTDDQLPSYLLSECLVYLIRDACQNKDDAILNAVFPILLTRCEKIQPLDASSLAPRSHRTRHCKGHFHS